jgi:glycosyltransferase involved in cell wall biosynthesis
MNPDLVAFDWWQPFFGPCQFGISLFLKKSLKKKVVLVCENFVSHEKRWIERILLKFGIFYPKAFISLSETVRKEIANTVGNRPVFKTEIPIYGWYRQDDGFDMAAEKKRYGWAPEDRVFLFFGYVRKYKGVDILIDAFAKLADKHPDLRLIVAGEFYDNPKEYEDLIKAHGLEDKIKLVNEFVPNEEVARYFRVCEMVVLPYRSGTQSGILNMAYGFQKPVVITDVGGLVETVDDGKTGVIVRQPTPDGVAEGMEKYLQLNETTDFATNIANKIQENNFDKVNAIFAELLTKFNA